MLLEFLIVNVRFVKSKIVKYLAVLMMKHM